MNNQNKFMIVSSARSGSTWLELMLGELSDTVVDFEFKFCPNYEPNPVHKVIDNPQYSCGDELSALSKKASVVGSKLTFDPISLPESAYKMIEKTIDPDIRIIHLTRPFKDIFYSWSRGVFHMLRNDLLTSTSTSIQMIKTINACNNYNDALNQYLNTHNRSMPRLLRNIHSSLLRKILTFKNSFSSQDVSSNECENKIKALFEQDRWMSSLSSKYKYYFRIEYKDVHKSFMDIVQFIGSSESEMNVANILKNPPTQKLPSVPFDVFFKNHQEVNKICRKYESLRLDTV